VGSGSNVSVFYDTGVIAGGTWLHKTMHRSPAVASGTGDVIAAGGIAMGIFFCVQFFYCGTL
jgi:hypothetical protein